MLIAGGSKAAARRAATHGLGFISQTDSPESEGVLRIAMPLRTGTSRASSSFPVPGAPTAVFVADDVDEAWDELGPHLLHDAVTAASYRPDDDSVASITRADNVADLREAGGPYRSSRPTRRPTTSAVAGRCRCTPLCGGIAPEVAWRYLERAGGRQRAGAVGLKENSMSASPTPPRGRVVDRRRRLDCHRCDPAPTGSGTCWRVGTFAGQGRQGCRRAGRR